MAITANDRNNATIGKPCVLGALFWGAADAPLPEGVPTNDPAKDLGDGYSNLGYLTEDGVTKTTSEDGDDIIAWGGDTIMHSQSSFSKTLTGTLAETVRKEALEFMYGASNVTVKDDGSITVNETSDVLPRGRLVVYTLQGNGDAQRICRQVFGDAQMTDRSGDESYNNSDVLGYPFTVTAYKFEDSDGVQKLVRKEYSPKVSATVAVSGVTVSPATANVAIGSKTKLTATIAPNNATNKEIVWSVDKTDIATIDNGGNVTGKKAGTAVAIAASAADSTKSGSCAVTVTTPSSGE